MGRVDIFIATRQSLFYLNGCLVRYISLHFTQKKDMTRYLRLYLTISCSEEGGGKISESLVNDFVFRRRRWQDITKFS